MKKTLTLAAAALAVGAVTTNAAITLGAVTLDLPVGDPAFQANGEWNPITTGDTLTVGAPAVEWELNLAGTVVNVGGTDLAFLQIDVRNLPISNTWKGSLGLPLGGVPQTASAAGNTAAPGVDVYNVKYSFWVDGVDKGKWEVTASYAVPEPSTYAMLAGLGLAGFALYRRMKA